MEDELLSGILAAEREIHLQIDSLEKQTEDRLERLRLELDRLLDDESKLLQSELEKARDRAGQTAEKEAETLLAEARTFATRLENIDIVELDRVVIRYLTRIYPEGADDCQDEQA